VIVCGRDAKIEYPPVETEVRLADSVESLLNAEHTSLEAALKLAQAVLPADSASRLVMVTDGNENLGNGLGQARALTERGVGIDVVPIRSPVRSEVAVEKVVAPSEATIKQKFELRVVVNNTADEKSGAPVSGRLKVFRRAFDQEDIVSDDPVTVAPGKHVFTVRQELEEPNFFTYSARFVPSDATQDRFLENNEATAITRIQGPGRILLIENSDTKGEFDFLAERLRNEGLLTTIIDTQALFTTLGDLQPFDSIILGNVPREAFSDEQVKMLAVNTKELGAGMIMLGGDNSFGAGGWTNSEIEKAMPVDFDVKNAKVAAIGALALVIDRSGSMSGEKLAMAKKAAIAAVDVLARHDYVSVAAFDHDADLIVKSTIKAEGTSIKRKIDQITEGGGTSMRPGMEMALGQLKRAERAAVRHMIVLTDGHTEPADFAGLVRRARADKITISSVAVGDGADVNLLSDIARWGAGKFYNAKHPKMLPRIFQKEARVVARPLVFEDAKGIVPQLKFPHEIMRGVGDKLPPITGYVLTTKKESPLVEVALIAPQPAGEENRTLLAGWTYGLGRTVALTTDGGKRWANQWTGGWGGYDKLFSQTVRWSMRSSGDQGKYRVATESKDGQVRVVVTAQDSANDFINGLNILGSAVSSELSSKELQLRQVAPGRYVGTFDADDAGSYFVRLTPGPGEGSLFAGVNVPYSAEYLDRSANEGLLSTLAGLTPSESTSGVVIEDTLGQGATGLVEAADVFRTGLRKPTSSQDIWPLLVLVASCLFFGDVLVRRVSMSFDWVPELTAKVRDRLRKTATVQQEVALNRLRSRKLEVAEALRVRQSTARFEPRPTAAAATPTEIETVTTATPPKPAVAPSLEQKSESLEESYTSRLLRAKKDVWKDKQ